MRLSADQIAAIRRLVRTSAGIGANVYLFGSRRDDSARGGDVDLYVETSEVLDYLPRAELATALEAEIGLPVDLVVKDALDVEKPFHRVAKLSGQKLI